MEDGLVLRDVDAAFKRLCWQYTPTGGWTRRGRAHGKITRAGDTMTFTECDNYFLWETNNGTTAPRGLRVLAVFGGDVANCGEEHVSQYILHNRATLERIVYAPDCTKGGTMVRPHYGSNSMTGRTDKAEFPALTHVSLNVDGVPVFMDVYVAPRLEAVDIICKTSEVPPRDREAIETSLRSWFPTLKRVAFCTRHGDEIKPF